MLPWLPPVAVDLRNLAARSNTVGFTLSLAIWPLLRAITCQPTTEVSPSSPGLSRQPPVTGFCASQ